MIGESLVRLAQKPQRTIAGFMSGTSMDGVDVVIARIRGCGPDTAIDLLGYDSVPYEPALRERLLSLQLPGTFNAFDVADLSFRVGDLHSDVLENLATRTGIPLSDIDLIGYSGLGLYHANRMNVDLGEVNVLADRTGATVICDLRMADCAAGGLGAPLSPYVDWILFADPEKSRAVQNIGGIANVCAIPAGATVDDLIGFDTGPGNMVIDGLISLLSDGRETFDRDGRVAASGQVNESLLAELMAHPYIRAGGVHNPTLMGMVRDLLAPIPVRTHEDFAIPSDAREALSWAILANETLHGRPANVPQITGARRRVILGKITPPTS